MVTDFAKIDRDIWKYTIFMENQNLSYLPMNVYIFQNHPQRYEKLDSY